MGLTKQGIREKYVDPWVRWQDVKSQKEAGQSGRAGQDIGFMLSMWESYWMILST